MLRVTTIHGGTPSGTGAGGSVARAVAAYLTEYYVGAGEEPGVWVGDPARRLALEGQVQREDLVSVLEGRDPTTGTRLGRGFQDRILADGRVVRPVIGFDATFSAPKTVSIMWALTSDPGWTEAHDTAVHAVLDHLQAHAATTRIRTSRGREYPDTGGLITAVFRQHTSRADDPQIHTHAFISSKVQTADGGWWALDARYLKRYQRALGGLYQTVLRAELTARYGITWGPVVNGQAELVAVPTELVDVFSKRTGQVDETLDTKIDAFTQRNGRAPTSYERAALVREAALDSRTAKSGLTHQDLTIDWTDQARALGWDPARLTARVTPPGQIRDAERARGSLGAVAATRAWLDGLDRPGGVFEDLTRQLSTSSTWHRGDVVRVVTDLVGAPAVLVGEQWAQLVERVVDRYLATCVSLDPPHPLAGDKQVRRADGRAVHLDPNIGAYTTTAILAQEEQIVTWVLDHTPDTPTPSVTTGRDLESGTRLDPTQHTAAQAVAGHDRFVVVIGPAGTGKTSMLTAARTDLEAHGRSVYGIAPSNQAAHVLQTETGIRADSVAKLLYEHTRPDRAPRHEWQLPAGITLVVDEAGMLPTAHLARLTELADQHQWRLVVVGDPYQLPPVGRGGMLTEVARHTSPVELGTVRRFTSEWEGPASLALRHADPGVIGTYEHHGRIHPGSFDEHTTTITHAWLDHTAVGRSVAVTAATNAEVDRLNTAIQTARLARGDLDPSLAVAVAGGEWVHPGDVVATRRNDRTLTTTRGYPIRNRATWTVTATDPTAGAITIHGRDGTITLPPDYVAEHVRLAYAATTHGTQGATVDHAITLVSGATDHRNLYVGATRGRHTNELHVIADTLEDARDVLDDVLARDRVDTPAVTVRRELLEMERGVGRSGATVVSAVPTITPHTSGEDAGGPGTPPQVVGPAGPDPRHGEPTPDHPVHGLETVTARRALDGTGGRGVGGGVEARTPTPPDPARRRVEPGRDASIVGATDAPGRAHPERTADPFHGLETVAEALQRLEAERDARQAPRNHHQELRTRLHYLERERAQLDNPWNAYERSPLDAWATARHNAQADVSIYTARLQHTSLGHRRPVRRLLEQAHQRLEQAETGWQVAYKAEVERLDPLIHDARAALERAAVPEPEGPRDRELDHTIADLQWETSIGNGERPTLDGLHARWRELLNSGELVADTQSVLFLIGAELEDRAALIEPSTQARLRSARSERDQGMDLEM